MNKEGNGEKKREAKEADETEAKVSKEAEEALAIAEKAIRSILFPADSKVGEPKKAINSVKQEADESKRTEVAKVAAKKESDRVAKERAKREAEEASKRADKVRKAKEAERAAKERRVQRVAEAKAKKAAKQAVSAKLHSGVTRITVSSPVDSVSVNKFERFLSEVKNLRLLLLSGSIDKDIKIIISVEQPTDLVRILSEMPLVERIVDKGKEIRVTLQAKQ